MHRIRRIACTAHKLGDGDDGAIGIHTRYHREQRRDIERSGGAVEPIGETYAHQADDQFPKERGCHNVPIKCMNEQVACGVSEGGQ